MIASAGSADSFSEGGVRLVEVDGLQIGVVMWRDQVYAALNVCPHMLGPVCEGLVGPKTSGDVSGQMGVDERVPVITCPWHRHDFNLTTGQSLRHERHRLKTYRAFVEDGQVMVEIPRRSRPQDPETK